MNPGVAVTHHDHGPEQGRGFIGFAKRWLYTTNHKDIGTLYLLIALLNFFVAGAMALLIRMELFQPGHRFLDPNFYNVMTTMHGLIMLFCCYCQRYFKRAADPTLAGPCMLHYPLNMRHQALIS